MKRFAVILLTGLLMTGCGNSTNMDLHGDISKDEEIESIVNESDSEIKDNYESDENKDSDSKEKEDYQEETDSTFSFADVKDCEFYFSSGAGGWRTVLYINEDGSFHGNFSDSDMGCSGPGYPNGTLYYCDFKGQFSNPVKVDDYSYEFEIENLSIEQEENKEEIIDETLYVYSYAYGLDDAEKMYMYLPGRSTSDFSEDLKMWLYIGDKTTTDCYVLYNKKPEYGFSGYQYEPIYNQLLESLEDTKGQAKIYEDSLKNDPLTQIEMNQAAEQLFTIWDNELNYIWSYVKAYLPDDKFQIVLAEQRNWIKQKDTIAEEDAKEFEGGSMQPMIYSSSLEVSTRERCYQLVEYLKDY